MIAFSIIRLEQGIYCIYMPKSVTWGKLIEIRRAIKNAALIDGIDKIAVIYKYPDDDTGVLEMPEYHKTGMLGIREKVSQTFDIHYEYVVFIGIPVKTVLGFPDAIREFYKLIHTIFPSLGRKIAFAENIDDAEIIIKDWKSRYE